MPTVSVVVLDTGPGGDGTAADVAGAPGRAWPLGPVSRVAATPAALAEHFAAADESIDAHLIWDPALGRPDADLVTRLLDGPGDVWHAGLKLGTAGLPPILDVLRPVWTLTRDPDPGIDAASWRLSLRACLVRTPVLAALGGPGAEFESVTGAGIELGYRWIRLGARLRHTPALCPADRPPAPAASMPWPDQWRMVRRHFPPVWHRWARWRAHVNRLARPAVLRASWRAVRREPIPTLPPPWMRDVDRPTGRESLSAARVSVILPTLNRYGYLRVLLGQLAAQTVAPHEVIIVDQTPADRRATAPSADDFPSLPIVWRQLDVPGQSTARNLAIGEATGDFLLFLDDDTEVDPGLIERHLVRLLSDRVDATAGSVHPPGCEDEPPSPPVPVVSDAVPTCNALVRREALLGSGLFDLAYDHGPKADRDLSMRLYLAGADLLMAPELRIVHHDAPVGGLRAIGARRVPWRRAQTAIWARSIPESTEFYWLRRFFTPRQQREWVAIRLTSFLRCADCPAWRQVARAVTGLLLLPWALWRIRRASRRARKLPAGNPRIPRLDDPAGGRETVRLDV
jgi:GT2 family glycosyltransferase